MEELFKAGLQRLEIDPTGIPFAACLEYVDLLCKWNRTYNLTAIKKPEEMLYRHVLDSLTVLPYIEGERCLDIGSGPGLPGLILALLQPDKEWFLLDSNQKKTRFLRHVKTELTIHNIEIVQSRIEDFSCSKAFDTLICRALAPLSRILELTNHLLTDLNQLLAMKGSRVMEEILVLGRHNFLIEIENLSGSDRNSSLKLLKIRR